MTSRQLVPIDPVEPSTTTRRRPPAACAVDGKSTPYRYEDSAANGCAAIHSTILVPAPKASQDRLRRCRRCRRVQKVQKGAKGAERVQKAQKGAKSAKSGYPPCTLATFAPFRRSVGPL